ncbi:Protein tyrosine kinase [Seminavis robusta]|uniref:Protein tyrosine kinase n=1 Tax=Seminavis robusta TaxID=568900 RepID=A0A9N8E1L6_9STRA|nr:Protein tyrosine kinase [Seminavis robusta]|eukprot:Sro526_g160500.1 Protein tyrosine kinase (1174) ;mRNA; r:48534-52055
MPTPNSVIGINSAAPVGAMKVAEDTDGSNESDSPSATSQTMEVSFFDAIPVAANTMDNKSWKEEAPPLQCAVTSSVVAVPSLRMLDRVELKEIPAALPASQNERATSVGSTQSQQTAAELDWSFLKKGRLYGRDAEMEQLQQAFHRRLDLAEAAEENSSSAHGSFVSFNTGSSTGTLTGIGTSNMGPELVLVSGKSGTGKTVLVKQALQKLVVEEHDGHFVLGKFDQLQTPEPYGPFVAAFTQLLIVLEQSYFQNMDGLRNRILHRVGMDACRVLCCLVPALGRLLGIQQDKSTSNVVLSTQQERLKVALKKFFQAICSSSVPLVLTLDDLQWADSGSLSLLETLVSESIPGLVVVGICRDNEVPWHHSFAGMLRRLEDDKGARIVHIEVVNLHMEATNELLADMLHQPQDACQPLAQVIHSKSEGNVLFILQVLKTLFAEEVLVKQRIDTQRRRPGSERQYQWLWHQDQWDESFANLDIVELVSYQIRHLPDSCQRLLQTAACIGAEFDLSTLTKLLDNSSDDMSSTSNSSTDDSIRQVLAIALEEQMIVQQMHRPNKYAFSHDRIQQSAYFLIPEQERPMAHLAVGRSLLQTFTEEELQENLFLVVNQLVWGIPLLTTEVDKNGLAELCLRAGQKASGASDFETALKYFRTGSELLANRHWRDEYHLSLDLFNRLAEAQSACRDIEGMNRTLDEILEHCRSSNDKVTPHLTRMFSLGSRSMFQEAIDIGFHVLDSLGERMPSKPRLIYLIADLVKVKGRLKGKTDKDIMDLPMMDLDYKNKGVAISVLNMLCLYAFCARQDYYGLLILRMVKLTLKYGLCRESSYAFACYGMVLCALGEFDDAYRYAQLSLQLLEQDKSMGGGLHPRVNFVVYAAIAPWKQPLRSTLDAIRGTIASAMDTCDHECFVYSAYTLGIQVYLSGENLAATEEELNQHMEIMAHFKQGPWLLLASMLRTVLRNWQGKSEDPLALEFASDMQDSSNKFDFQLQVSTLNAHRLCLSYHFGDIDSALATAKIVRSFEKDTKFTFFGTNMYLYDGLTSLEAACCRGKKRKRLAHAKSVLKKLETLSNHCPENLLPHVYLLRGEVQAVKGNLLNAIDLLKKASDYAASEHNLQLQALANERAAIAYQRIGGDSESAVGAASALLERAITLYDEWGAAAVVVHLKEKHGLQ